MALHAATLGTLLICVAGILMASSILSYFSTILVINRNILTRLDSLLIATWMATIVVQVVGGNQTQVQLLLFPERRSDTDGPVWALSRMAWLGLVSAGTVHNNNDHRYQYHH